MGWPAPVRRATASCSHRRLFLLRATRADHSCRFFTNLAQMKVFPWLPVDIFLVNFSHWKEEWWFEPPLAPTRRVLTHAQVKHHSLSAAPLPPSPRPPLPHSPTPPLSHSPPALHYLCPNLTEYSYTRSHLRRKSPQYIPAQPLTCHQCGELNCK